VLDLQGDPVTYLGSPLLTSRRTLIAPIQAAGLWRLEELALDGHAVSDCPLPETQAFWYQPSARAGHWLALVDSNNSFRLVSYAIPGLEPAATGLGQRTRKSQPGRAAALRAAQPLQWPAEFAALR